MTGASTSTGVGGASTATLTPSSTVEPSVESVVVAAGSDGRADVSWTGIEFASSAREGSSTTEAVVVEVEFSSVGTSTVDSDAICAGVSMTSVATVSSASTIDSDSSGSPKAAATDIGSDSTR